MAGARQRKGESIMLRTYYPEMNESKPSAQAEAQLSYNGKHYFVSTPLTVKTGVGIEFLKTYKASELTPQGQRKAGWNLYQMTKRAFDKFKVQHTVSMEMLLD